MVYFKKNNFSKKRKVIKKNIKAGAINKDNLFDAVEKNYVKGVKEAIADGADVNVRGGVRSHGYTPLILASERGHIDVVKELLDNKANVNRSDRLKKTSLHLASYMGHPNVVQMLINYGANIAAKDTSGKMPIHYAIEQLNEAKDDDDEDEEKKFKKIIDILENQRVKTAITLLNNEEILKNVDRRSPITKDMSVEDLMQNLTMNHGIKRKNSSKKIQSKTKRSLFSIKSKRSAGKKTRRK